MAYQEVFKRVEMKYVLPPDIRSQIKDEPEYTMGLYQNPRPIMHLAHRREAYASTDRDGFRPTRTMCAPCTADDPRDHSLREVMGTT